MKFIIPGTNRPNSRSLQIAQKVQEIYGEMDEETTIMQLGELDLQQLDGSQYSTDKPAALQKAVDDLLVSDGLIFVVPEYNGSLPGILKYFIDHWAYPDTFVSRPCAFIGLGGMFGGLRPVEHLQQVMGYRNAFMFPERIFLTNVWSTINDQGEFIDIDPASATSKTHERLKRQAEGFSRFVRALKSEGLDAASRLGSN